MVLKILPCKQRNGARREHKTNCGRTGTVFASISISESSKIVYARQTLLLVLFQALSLFVALGKDANCQIYCGACQYMMSDFTR